MAQSNEEFVAFLDGLTSSHPSTRRAAENQLEALRNSSGEGSLSLPFSFLGAIVNPNVPAHLRQLASVMLRRLIIEDSEKIFVRMSAEMQMELRKQLLEALNCEQDTSLKTKICNIVGEFACIVLTKGEWPELLQYTVQHVQSQNSQDRETGLALIGMIVHVLPTEMFQKPENVQLFLSIFSSTLADESNTGRVMIASIRALASYLAYISQESEFDNYVSLIDAVLAGITKALQTDAMAVAYAEAMIEIAEESSIFFASKLSIVFHTIMNIISDSGAGGPNATARSGTPGSVDGSAVSAPVKHMLMEFLVTLCVDSPKRTRKAKGPDGTKGYFAERFIPICVRMMTSVAEDPLWHTREHAEGVVADNSNAGADAGTTEVEGTADCDVGETALDRVTVALGLRSTFKIITSQLVILFTTPAWQFQYSGLRVIGNYLQVSAGIPDETQAFQHREEVISTICTFATNSNARVRGAAFYAISQLFFMHGKAMTKTQIDRLLGVILESTSSAQNPAPRVRQLVLLSLVNLIDAVPFGIVEKNISPVLQSIVGALTEGPVLVQEVCMSAIMSVTETVQGPSLASYYDDMMPVLKQLLSHAHSLGLEDLWGKGLECCARLGEACGREKFYPDALEMMSTLVQLQGQLDDESDARPYLMKAWVRVARCLEAEFLPFQPLVMEKILAILTQDLSEGMGDLDMDELEKRSDIEMVETEDGGFKVVRTSAVEELASACQLLVLLVEKLQEHFYPFADQSIRALAPLLKSPHDDVRSFAYVALPEIVRCVGKATVPDKSVVGSTAEYLLGLLIEAVKVDDVLELIMTGLQALKLLLHYLCTDWHLLAQSGNSQNGNGNGSNSNGIGNNSNGIGYATNEPPTAMPAICNRMLTATQMEAISDCAKVVLRDSLQRRAVLRAEATVMGGADEEDADDERNFLDESFELHYNVAEVVGILLRTHGDSYTPVYMQSMHDSITQMSNPYCIKEDRQVAFFVICDVIEFGFDTKSRFPNSAGGIATGLASMQQQSESIIPYLSQVIPILSEACVTPTISPGARQSCVYGIGVAAEKYPREFAPYAAAALQALASCVHLGEIPGKEERGSCTDNAVSSVGIILEQMEVTGSSSGLQFEALWGQWLEYLPLRHDEEESDKVVGQLLRLLSAQHRSLCTGTERLAQIIFVLLQVLDATKIPGTRIREAIRSACGMMGSGLDNLLSTVSSTYPHLAPKLDDALRGTDSVFPEGTSPLGHAPIHDVLLRR